MKDSNDKDIEATADEANMNKIRKVLVADILDSKTIEERQVTVDTWSGFKRTEMMIKGQ